MGLRPGRRFALSAGGAAVSFLGFIIYARLVAEPVRLLGLPPAGWFGTDYTDPRGAAVSFSISLALLGVLYFSLSRVLSRRLAIPTRLLSFWACNPVSTATGLLAARALVVNDVRFEYTQGVWILALFGWPVFWRLATLGSRQARWMRAVAEVAVYSLTPFVLFMVQFSREHGYWAGTAREHDTRTGSHQSWIMPPMIHDLVLSGSDLQLGIER